MQPKRLLETRFWRREKGADSDGAGFQLPWWFYLPFEHVALIVLLGFNLLMIFPLFRLKTSPNAFSAPLLPFLCRGIGRITGADFPQAAVWVLLLFGSFGVFSLYFFVQELAGRRLPGLLAAVFYSLPLADGLPLWTKHALEMGDGSHVVSLALAPMVAYLTLRFLKSGDFNFALRSSLGTALVALISPFGAFVLVVFFFVCTFSEILLGRGRVKILRLLVCLGLALGFACFWYNPFFVKKIIFESWQGQTLAAVLRNMIPISSFVLPVVGTFGFLLFERKPGLQSLFVSLGLFFAFFFLNLGGRFSQGGDGLPSRFSLEFWLGTAFVGGLVATHVFDFLRGAKKIGRFVLTEGRGERLSFGFILVLLLVCSLWILGSAVRPVTAEAYGQILGASQGEVAGIWEIRQEAGGGLAIWTGRVMTFITGALVVSLRRRLLG